MKIKDIEKILHLIGDQKIDIDQDKKQALMAELFGPEKEITYVQEKKPMLDFNLKSLLAFGAVALTAVLVFITVSSFKSPETGIITPPEVVAYNVNGYIQKGPFISGSDITIQELDSGLAPTGSTYKLTTRSDFGDYEFSHDLSSPYIEVFAEGYYFNEVAGSLSKSKLTLRAITNLANNTNVNVNLLTTLSADRIKYLVTQENMDFGLAKIQAEGEVLQVFNLRGVEVDAFEDLDLSKSNDGDAVLIAISAIMQGERSVAELSELISKISLDLETDGKLNNVQYFDELVDSARDLTVVDIRNSLIARYRELGLSITIPEFERYIKQLVSFGIQSVTPTDGHIGVTANPVIEVQFSKEIKPETITQSTFYLRDGTEFVDAEIVVDPNLRTISLRPHDDLALSPSDISLPLRKYTIVLTSGVQSIDGESLSKDFKSSFTMKRYTKLAVTGVTPLDGASDVLKDDMITVWFNQALDPTSVNDQTVIVRKNADVVFGVVSYDSNEKAITFTPDGGFELSPSSESQPLNQYHIELTTGIKGANGESLLAQYSSRFTTVRQKTINILELSPPIGTRDVDPWTQIHAEVDSDLNPSTVTSNAITLQSSYGFVSGSVEYDSATHEVVFSPYQALSSEVEYTATFSELVEAVNGATLPHDWKWSFTTARLDTQSGLTAYYPLNGNVKDSSGNERDGQMYGATPVTNRKGISNAALRLDGGENRIEIPKSIDLKDGDWAISFWVSVPYQSQHQNGGKLLRQNGATGSVDYFSVWQDLHTTFQSQFFNDPYTVLNDRWYHVVVTRRSTVVTTYVDGVAVDHVDSVFVTSSPTAPFSFGGQLWASIDDVRFYNRFLNKYEVRGLYIE